MLRRGVTFKDLLRDVLPEEVLKRVPRSFYIVGDIALISLDEDVAKGYGKEIARAIMELHPSIKAVFARGPRSGVERVPKLLHLGGERRTTTIHREYGIRMVVDIEKAYFNPALSEEHRRVSETIRDGSNIADLFTGVGPFALHAAKRKHCYVLAADINPYAVQLLRQSIRLNKLRGLIDPVQMDSLRMLSGSALKQGFDVVIMNLPHRAHEYVAYAFAIVRSGGLVHVYIIASKSSEAVNRVVSRLASFRIVEVRKVIDYAPHKYVFRVSIEKP